MRNEVDFLLKLKGRDFFVQIFDYKFEEEKNDLWDSDDEEEEKNKKFLKCYILLENIQGITLR